MNDKDLNNFPSGDGPVPIEEGHGQVSGMDTQPSSSHNDDDNKPKEGLTFKWFNLVLGVALFLALSEGGGLFTDDWSFYIYLSIVVCIHELGHVSFGRLFGCHIKEMQVFFLPFVSYKPQQTPGGSSWRDITWSLGTLPLGGFTVFKSRETKEEGDVDGMDATNPAMDLEYAHSPYIEDKPAWQRLLISAAGVLFNFATFFIFYYVFQDIYFEYYDAFRMLAILSLLLALLNILPVYPLDGGAIVFALYEIVTGEKPSTAFTNVCAWIGFIFIILFFWVFPDWLGGIIHYVLDLFY